MTQLLIDRGALKMALNVLRTNGKGEVAAEIEVSCQQIEKVAYITKTGSIYGGDMSLMQTGETPLFKAVV